VAERFRRGRAERRVPPVVRVVGDREWQVAHDDPLDPPRQPSGALTGERMAVDKRVRGSHLAYSLGLFMIGGFQLKNELCTDLTH